MKRLKSLGLGLLVAVSAIGSVAHAQGVDQNNSNLPPEGVYLSPIDVHAQYSGPGLAIVHGHGPLGSPVGTFPTEMLSMSLTITGGVMIRESPTLASLGMTTITPIGGGMFHIDSFFDVFTELSLDGGASWIPSDGSTHVNLVPEPTTTALLGMGLVGLVGCVWRRRA